MEYDVYIKTICDFGESTFKRVSTFRTACIGGIYKGDVYFTTQQEINDFGTKCYSAIEGNVSLFGQDISDLRPLKSITYISGHLQISSDRLVSLEGLENLKVIGGLILQGNVKLRTIESLSNLETASSLIFISNWELGSIKRS